MTTTAITDTVLLLLGIRKSAVAIARKSFAATSHGSCRCFCIITTNNRMMGVFFMATRITPYIL